MIRSPKQYDNLTHRLYIEHVLFHGIVITNILSFMYEV